MLITWHPPSAKVGTNFTDKWQSPDHIVRLRIKATEFVLFFAHTSHEKVMWCILHFSQFKLPQCYEITCFDLEPVLDSSFLRVCAES
jgi:hypothetical protein